MGRSPMKCSVIAVVDAVAGHVREFLIYELCGIGFSLANEVRIKPLFGNALELAEKMELWLLAGIAELGVEEAMREME